MSATLDSTEADAFTALRAFLVGVLPTGTDVLRAQVNRVPEPTSANFVLLTPLSRTRLGQNVTVYSDGQRAGGTAPSVAQISMATEVVIQADIHGPNSANSAQVIATLFRDEVAATAMDGTPVVPLYASEPMQTPFMNGENQMEYRWTVDLHLQSNQVVTLPQQFADNVVIGVISVDAVYPPTGV